MSGRKNHAPAFKAGVAPAALSGEKTIAEPSPNSASTGRSSTNG